jgi:hypothetical protein
VTALRLRPSKLASVELERDLRRIAEAAAVHAAEGEDVSGILPAEPLAGIRLYVCAYSSERATTWLVFDATGVPVQERALVHDAVSIAALCEVAEEAAGVEADAPRIATPGWLDEVGAEAPLEVAAAVKAAAATVEELVRDVERGYKRPLS